MALYQYQYYDEATNTIEAGKPLKEPYVWSDNMTDPDYFLVTDQGIILEKIRELYYKYEVDGMNYFRDIRSQLVYDYKSGSRSSSDIFSIETTLRPVIDRLTLGDWMSAQYELSLITPTPPFDQALYDQISAFIAQYIADNYTA